MSSFRKPVITLPVRVHRRAIKRREKQRLEELEDSGSAYPKGNRDLPPVIACRRKELNFYQGQRHNPFKKLQLATEHWPSRSTIGDYFAFNAYKTPLSTNFHDRIVSLHTKEIIGNTRPDFQPLGLDSRLETALKNLKFLNPTNIQQLAIPGLLKGQSAIVAAETGNGKTLAFLLPLLHNTLKLKEAAEKAQEDNNARLLHLNRPLAVIVTPGRELAHQIFDVCRSLCSAAEVGDVNLESNSGFQGLGLDFRLVLGGNLAGKTDQSPKPTDVLIGTPGALVSMFKKRFFHSGSVSTLVFDEADTMVDDTFRGLTYTLMSMLMKPRHDGPLVHGDIQTVFIGATFPNYIYDAFGEVIDTESLETYRTGQLHRVPYHIYQKFIRVPKTGKVNYLMEVIEKDLAKQRSLMIFSNKSSTSNFVAKYLMEKGIEAETFNASSYWRTRYQSLERFQRGQVKVLSCTDLASRGMDTSQVQHVVNYDFPSNASDYLHRIGRVGRVGSKFSPMATSLVCGQRSIAVVQQLELAVRTNREIDGVDANISRIIKDRNELTEEGSPE